MLGVMDGHYTASLAYYGAHVGDMHISDNPNDPISRTKDCMNKYLVSTCFRRPCPRRCITERAAEESV